MNKQSLINFAQAVIGVESAFNRAKADGKTESQIRETFLEAIGNTDPRAVDALNKVNALLASPVESGHEIAGTAFDPNASGHELLGRKTEPESKPPPPPTPKAPTPQPKTDDPKTPPPSVTNEPEKDK